MCVNIYIYIYIYVYIYIRVYICMYTYIYVYIYVYEYRCLIGKLTDSVMRWWLFFEMCYLHHGRNYTPRACGQERGRHLRNGANPECVQPTSQIRATPSIHHVSFTSEDCVAHSYVTYSDVT